MAKRRRGQVPTPGRAGARAEGRPRPIGSIPAGGRTGGPSRGVVLVGALVVLAVGVVSFALFSGGGSNRTKYECAEQMQPDPSATVANPIVTPDFGNSHQAAGSTVELALCPPASGPHYQVTSGVAPARPAFYGPDAGIGPGSWVHNLEHGFVVALYRCVDDVCPSEDDLSRLRQFVLQGPSTASSTRCGYQSKVLAARFDSMATPFALMSWRRVLLLDSFDPAVAKHVRSNAGWHIDGPRARLLAGVLGTAADAPRIRARDPLLRGWLPETVQRRAWGRSRNVPDMSRRRAGVRAAT